ncbi:MAG: hypothetical protein LUC94_15000 [Clostridiales bacterium]|nr:hypothetical protein [Clostridiales bacterium]
MMTVMEQLYYGRISPCEKIVPEDREYQEANREAGNLLNGLSEKLEQEACEMVDELCSHRSVAEDILAREHFKYGLSLGLRLMQKACDFPYLKEKDV